MKILLVMPLIASFLGGCVSVSEKVDAKTGIKVTTVAVRGCNNPSQTLTFVQRPGKREDSYASTGGDVCNTLVGTAGQVVASAVLPKGAGITNTVVSGSQAVSSQTSKVQVVN